MGSSDNNKHLYKVLSKSYSRFSSYRPVPQGFIQKWPFSMFGPPSAHTTHTIALKIFLLFLLMIMNMCTKFYENRIVGSQVIGPCRKDLSENGHFNRGIGPSADLTSY